MPDQVGDLILGNRPVMCDARDPAQRIVGVFTGCVHLADDRVFGAVDGGKNGHRGADAITSVVLADGFE
jgi:hypothetical protein